MVADGVSEYGYLTSYGEQTCARDVNGGGVSAGMQNITVQCHTPLDGTVMTIKTWSQTYRQLILCTVHVNMLSMKLK